MENEKDWDSIFPTLQHLKYNKHEIIIFNVHHKSTESDFEFENKQHIFTDLETGKKVKINPEQVREEYSKRKIERSNQIKLKAAQYKIDFIEADVAKNIDQILLPYLIKRKKMK